MKSNKGITLTGLIIYIIAMTIIMGVISSITIYFYKNTNSIQSTTDNSSSLTRFNEYFTKDIKEKEVKAKIENENKKITLTKANGEEIKYTIAGDGIYRNKVKICSNIIQENTNFTKEEIYDKTKITVQIKIGETETIEKTLEYTIQN